MSTNVEIVVPDDESADELRQVLRSVSGVSLKTRPSGHASSMFAVLVHWLESPELRRKIEEFFQLVRWPGSRDRFAVFVWQPSSTRTPTWEALQSLAAFSARIGEKHMPFVAPDEATFRRLVLAHRAGAEKKLIATAAVEGPNLVVWSCEPKRYAVPITELPSLRRMSAGALQELTISPSGSRIHWDAGDVDLNMDTVLEHADLGLRRKHEAGRRRELKAYAKVIRTLREERGLSQSEIQGLSERQVRRLERGDTLPHGTTLAKLARAHRMSVDDYLRELADRTKQKRRPA